MMKKYNQEAFLSQASLGIESRNNVNKSIGHKIIEKFLLFLILFITLGGIGNHHIYAQTIDLCDGLSDPVISSQYSNLFKTEKGFVVFGMSAEPAGNPSSVNTVPVLVTPENGYNYTGTPLLASLGSRSANIAQYLLLTTSGLYSWGGVRGALPYMMKSSPAFGGVALPTGVLPTDIKYMTSGGGVTALLTNLGEVYIAAENVASSGIYGVATPNIHGWNKVRGLGGGDLTDVKFIKVTTHAAFAVTNSGDFYTWGDKASLGNGTAPAVIKTPKKMTLPFPAADLKMIAMTLNTADTFTGVSYYALNGSNKKVYAFGDNYKAQLGQGNNVDLKSWTIVKRAAGVELTGVTFINANDNSFINPSAGAITEDGTVYLWGHAIAGKLGNPSYMTDVKYARVPDGFVPGSKATYVELGGYFSIYTTEDNDHFCFAGLSNYGVMGNGVNTMDELREFDCEDTGLIDDFCLNKPKVSSFKVVKHGRFENPRGDGFAQVGDRILYTFRVENTGNVPLTDIRITDPLITVNGGPISLNAGQIDTNTFSGVYIITDADLELEKVYNLATGSAKNPQQNTITVESVAQNPLDPSDPKYPTCPNCTMTEVPESGILITNPMIYQKVK
ncbi:hypothetical protein [Flavobacterium sp. NKUCC04_CG]|uniref:DUF7507 domain-containing protein n=1 Tax=Flavobacterium sp. NKUCC04_CG TaxID=2842121 RepID=UPI001C5AE2D3|nr:hypothetical protein [Flavobacterium sp. NKUCC04_CG]MBW3519210.1 hypothetical protein [Flavobacterium sp. NKUCC04_CG]